MLRRSPCNPRHLLPLGVALVLATGCDRTDDPDALSVLRDSAGVRIAENVWPDSTAVSWWTVAAEPAVEIGGLDASEAYALFQAADAQRFADGSIVVAHGGGHDVRIYDRAGIHVRTFGRQGDGPGEFQRPTRVITQPGDSVLVYDAQAQRISLFSRDGDFARDWRLAQGDGRPAALIGALADGSLIARGNARFGEQGPPSAGRLRNDVVFLRFVDATTPGDTLVMVPGNETFVRTETDANARITAISIFTLPFGLTTQAAIGGDEIVIGTQDAPELRVHGADGTLRRIVRTGAPMPAVTTAHVEAWQERMSEGLPPDRQAEYMRGVADLPHGTHVPPYGAVHVDERGFTWVQDYDDRINPAGGWSVYDREGRIAARIRLPAALRVHHIGEDFVLGIERDDLDVEHVRLYALTRTPPLP